MHDEHNNFFKYIDWIVLVELGDILRCLSLWRRPVDAAAADCAKFGTNDNEGDKLNVGEWLALDGSATFSWWYR